MTTALDVASYIKESVRLPNFDTKKLQKLMYFSQAWTLAWTGKPLFLDEFQAWPEGPVVRSVFGFQRNEGVPPFLPTSVSAEEKELIDSVLSHYGHLSHSELVDLTHAHRPWQESRGDLAPDAPSQSVIPRDSIREYYTRLAIVDADSPSRQISPSAADDQRVRSSGERAAARWQRALALLATR